jgi:hypothetical protein
MAGKLSKSKPNSPMIITKQQMAGEPPPPRERSIIDIAKLEGSRTTLEGWTAACPICRLMGRDKGGNHLKIWKSNMAFNCIIGSDALPDHNRLILQAIGTLSDGSIESLDFDVETIINGQSTTTKYYSEDMPKRLIRDFSYWTKRGINPDILDSYEGGVASIGQMNHRYVFVLRDEHARIVAFSGRYINPIKNNSLIVRWKHLGKKSLALFDGTRVFAEVAKTKVITLVEGIGCVLALRCAGVTSLPVFGTRPSSALIAALIRANPEKIVVSFNNEASGIGNDASEKCKTTLLKYFPEEKISIRLPPQKDWLDSSVEEREIFKKEIDLAAIEVHATIGNVDQFARFIT